MNWNTTTSTTTGTTVTIKWTYYTVYQDHGLTAKERARRERSRKWLQKAKERADAWFAAEMKKIEEWSAANAWRPDISSRNDKNPHQLNYWTITASGEEDEMEPLWRTIHRRYRNGWIGLTVNDPSDWEKERIDAFLKAIPKKNKLIERGGDWLKWSDHDGIVGKHKAMQLGVWFRNLDDHNRFVELLESFPARTEMFVLGDAAEIDSIMHLLEGQNYKITRGSEATTLTMPLSENAVLAKMFVG